MTLLSAILFLLALVFAGLGGAALLSRLFAGESDAEVRFDASVSFAIPVGLILAAIPGWLLSGFFRVPVRSVALPLAFVALVVSIALFSGTLQKLKPASWRGALLPAGIFAGLFLFFLWLRWPIEMRFTEKPMDFAILTSLMMSPDIPMMDPWMSGTRFPYYHFGTYLFALPLRAAGVAPEYAYNLIAALLPALLSLAAFGVIRSRRGGRTLAAAGAVLLVAGGTMDGVRQLFGPQPLKDFDFLWESSRRVKDIVKVGEKAGEAITEWPLFTYRLGDLHPHAVELPLLIVLAGMAGRIGTFGGLLFDGLLFAAIISANPWNLPASLLLLAAGNLSERGFARSFVRSILAVILAIPFLVPFLLSPRPRLLGIGAAHFATTIIDGFLHLGALAVVPALAVGIALVRSRRTPDGAFLAATFFPALGIGLAVATKKPVLGLAAGFIAAVAYLVFRKRDEGAAAVEGDAPPGSAIRAGLLFAGAGATLVLVPEVLVVLDTYGEPLRRMNTIFKCYVGAWPLLVIGSALLLPLALSSRRAFWQNRILVTFALLAMLVHPVASARERWKKTGPFPGLNGLAWMEQEAPGDRKAVEWLRKNAPSGAVVAEATGAAYSDYARIGSASGRPTILGWANHEGLWRGGGEGEVHAREADLKTIYTSQDPLQVLETVKRRNIRYVVVGTLEKKDFGPIPFPTRLNFIKVFDENGTAVFEAKP